MSVLSLHVQVFVKLVVLQDVKFFARAFVFFLLKLGRVVMIANVIANNLGRPLLVVSVGVKLIMIAFMAVCGHIKRVGSLNVLVILISLIVMVRMGAGLCVRLLLCNLF